MKYCEDCGTKLSSNICPNCSEELFIVTEQYEFLPDNLSTEFLNKVEIQKEREHERFMRRNYDNSL